MVNEDFEQYEIRTAEVNSSDFYEELARKHFNLSENEPVTFDQRMFVKCIIFVFKF